MPEASGRAQAPKRKGEATVKAVGEIYVIDRFEGEYAVCEDANGKTRDFARVELPRGAGEGDVIRRTADGAFYIDSRETAKRREQSRRLFESLLGD